MTNNNPDQPLPLLPYLCQPSAILWLVLVGELLAVVLMLADSSSHFSWAHLGSVSMVIQWIVLCCALVLCQIRHLLNRLKPIPSGCLAYGICLFIAGLVLWLAQLLVPTSFNTEQWVKAVLIAAIFSGILLRYLYLQQQLSNQQQAELHARIQSLQARIRPHFLFNSMNTIASLIAINPKAAEKTVEDLSDLFRSSLQTPGLVPLSDEIDLCHRYIAIEQMRLDDRLTMEWHYKEPLPKILVPSLFLQPLLENAIGHGVQQLTNGGKITFSISVFSDYLLIQIDNPVPDTSSTTDSTHQGHQLALNNIIHRLELHYGEQASLEATENNLNNTYSVNIKLPLPVKTD